MILHLFRRRPSASALSLYELIVAQARSAAFYRDYGVSDTLDGRFEMVVLHLSLLLYRLKSAGDDGIALGQQVFDRFCQDMDQNLREIGVSDLKVPKEMRRVGEAYYGRAGVYEAAFREPDTLPAVLARNVVADSNDAAALRLADYVRGSLDQLALQSMDDFRCGAVTFAKV